MKLTSWNFRYSTLLLLCFSLLLSCNKGTESNLLKPQITLNQSDNLSSIDGIIRFRNQKIFELYVSELKSDAAKRLELEKIPNFVSLNGYCNNLNSNIESQKYEKSSLIEIHNGFAKSTFFNFDIGNVINKDGYVIVGPLLYLYTNQQVKSIEIDDFKKIKSLSNKLLNSSESDKSINLFVSDVKLIKSIQTCKTVGITENEQLNKGSGARIGLFGSNQYTTPATYVSEANAYFQQDIHTGFYEYTAQSPVYDYDDYDCDHPNRTYDASMGYCPPIVVGYTYSRAVCYFVTDYCLKDSNYYNTNVQVSVTADFTIYIDNVGTHITSSFYTGQYGYVSNNGPLYNNSSVPMNAVVEVEGNVYHSMSTPLWYSNTTVTH